MRHNNGHDFLCKIIATYKISDYLRILFLEFCLNSDKI